jgi:hypothetical protein
MGLKLEVPADVQRAYAKQRVTLPSVTPAARFAQDSVAITRKFSDDAVKEAEWKRNDAVGDDNGRPRDDMEAQMGRILTGAEVEAKLRKLAPCLTFEDSKAFPTRRLIYRPEPREKEGKKLIAAMEKGPMPEFSVILKPTEKWIEPSEIKRGWRTVLGHCIVSRMVSPERVVREFGIPTHDSEKWFNVVR